MPRYSCCCIQRKQIIAHWSFEWNAKQSYSWNSVWTIGIALLYPPNGKAPYYQIFNPGKSWKSFGNFMGDGWKVDRGKMDELSLTAYSNFVFMAYNYLLKQDEWLRNEKQPGMLLETFEEYCDQLKSEEWNMFENVMGLFPVSNRSCFLLCPFPNELWCSSCMLFEYKIKCEISVSIHFCLFCIWRYQVKQDLSNFVWRNRSIDMSTWKVMI